MAVQRLVPPCSRTLSHITPANLILCCIAGLVQPVFTGIICALFFGSVKHLVLRADDQFERAVLTYPIVVFVGITVNLFFILFKSDNNLKSDIDYGHAVVLPCSLGGGFICALLAHFVVVPRLKVKINREHEEAEQEAEAMGRSQSGEPTINKLDMPDMSDTIEEIDVDTYIEQKNNNTYIEPKKN